MAHWVALALTLDLVECTSCLLAMRVTLNDDAVNGSVMQLPTFSCLPKTFCLQKVIVLLFLFLFRFLFLNYKPKCKYGMNSVTMESLTMIRLRPKDLLLINKQSKSKQIFNVNRLCENTSENHVNTSWMAVTMATVAVQRPFA